MSQIEFDTGALPSALIARPSGDVDMAVTPAMQGELLAVGEAASNAVEHPLEPSPPAIVVSMMRGEEGETRMEIRDHGNWDAQPSARHRGRGMQIMQAISEGDVAVERTAGGTTVTIRLRRGER